MAKAAATTATKKPAAKAPPPAAPEEVKAARPEPKLLPATAIAPQSPKITAGSIKDALSAAGATKTTIQMVPLDNIHVIPGFNARQTDTMEHAEKIDGLVRDMLKRGFDPAKPLTGFVGKDGDADVIYVTDGHGRLEAARRAVDEGAEITVIPMVMRPSSTSMAEHNINLIRENSGLPLSMAEKAIVVKRLLKLGVAEDDLAETLGITQRYVDQVIMLINAPRGVRALVKLGRIAGTEAIRLLTKYKKNPEKAEEVMLKMVERAEASGSVKASRKHSDEGTKAGRRAATSEEKAEGKKLVVKMESVKSEIAFSNGQEFPLTDIRRIKGLLPDTDWYSLLTDKDGYAVATEDFRIQITVTRPKKEQPKVTDGVEAPPKKARRLKDLAAESTDEGDENEGDEGDENQEELPLYEGEPDPTEDLTDEAETVGADDL